MRCDTRTALWCIVAYKSRTHIFNFYFLNSELKTNLKLNTGNSMFYLFTGMVFLPHILRCYIVFLFFVFEQKLNSDKNLPQRQIFLVSSQNLPRRQFFCCLSPKLTPVTDFVVFLLQNLPQWQLFVCFGQQN